jgi:hypothetical protein
MTTDDSFKDRDVKYNKKGGNKKTYIYLRFTIKGKLVLQAPQLDPAADKDDVKWVVVPRLTSPQSKLLTSPLLRTSPTIIEPLCLMPLHIFPIKMQMFT